MIFHKRVLQSILLAAIASATSCARGGFPTAPQEAPKGEAQAVADLTSGKPGESDVRGSGHYLWMYYNVYVDLAENIVEAVPLRQVGGHWNVLKFLEQAGCTDCLSIIGVSPGPDGTVNFDLSIRHPFPSPNLTGFDVRGIAMFNGTHVFPEAGLNTSDRTAGEGELVNADGYTSLFNSTTEGSGPGGFGGYTKGKFATITAPNSLLNGYKRHISDDPANTRNAFYFGDEIAVTYQIDMPDGPFVFGYAVDANWAPPLVKPVTDPMTQFPDQANCPEPWKIEVDESPVSAGLTDMGGKTILHIDVYDWKGYETHADPVVECPELFDGSLTAPMFAHFVDYTRYNVEVENQKLAAAGRYKCLIKVVDDEDASAPDWLDLVAYQVCPLGVIPNQPPVALPAFYPQPTAICMPVHFWDSGSYDPDGVIVGCEWDWENDGIYDETGCDVYHAWDIPGTYHVRFRVTSSDGGVGESESPIELMAVGLQPVSVPTVDKNLNQIGVLFNFDGSSSHDGDCSGEEIVQWEWDWENDGTYDETGETLSHAYSETGNYNVRLKVTDNEGDWSVNAGGLPVTVVNGWVRTWGAASSDTANVVAVDDPSFVYVGGEFSSTVDFDPGPGIVECTSNGNHDAYVCKFDLDGNFIWVRSWGNANWDRVTNIGVDASGAVHLSGEFEGEVDFDPGPGIRMGNSNGSTDAYVLVLDSGGNFLSVVVYGEAQQDSAFGLAIDDVSGASYVAGMFYGEVDFDPSAGSYYLTSNGSSDCYFAAYTKLGVLLWAVSWGGTEMDVAYEVELEAGQYLYVTGLFRDTVDFDPDVPLEKRTSAGMGDVFLSQFKTTGGFNWVQTWGGADHDLGVNVAGDEHGYVAVTGMFSGTADFDPGSGVDNRVSVGDVDQFISEFDANGNYKWARTWGSTTIDWGPDVIADSSGNWHIAGDFTETVDFDPDPVDVEERISAGSYDGYLLCLDSEGLFQWVATFGSAGWDKVYGVDVDQSDFLYSCGYFHDTVDFYPGDAIMESSSNGEDDAFLLKLPGDGIW